MNQWLEEQISSVPTYAYTIDHQGLIEVLRNDPVAFFYDTNWSKMTEEGFWEKYLWSQPKGNITFLIQIKDGNIPHYTITAHPKVEKKPIIVGDKEAFDVNKHVESVSKDFSKVMDTVKKSSE